MSEKFIIDNNCWAKRFISEGYSAYIYAALSSEGCNKQKSELRCVGLRFLRPVQLWIALGRLLALPPFSRECPSYPQSPSSMVRHFSAAFCRPFVRLEEA